MPRKYILRNYIIFLIGNRNYILLLFIYIEEFISLYSSSSIVHSEWAPYWGYFHLIVFITNFFVQNEQYIDVLNYSNPNPTSIGTFLTYIYHPNLCCRGIKKQSYVPISTKTLNLCMLSLLLLSDEVMKMET